MTGANVESEPLAVHGGRPVRDTNLPYGRQRIEEADIQAVVDVLRSDMITTGPKVAEFEEAVAGYVGARYAVAFSSGTAALHGAAFAAGLGPGDEAITTPLTFCATANCVLYMGAKPVFADVEPDTMNLDPEQVAQRITSATKAILPVHYAGHPAAMEEITTLAHRAGLVVIEDAAHALGAEYNGTKIGSLSDMTMFSFHPVKHLTTGEGGLVTTENEDYYRLLKRFRNHGIDLEARERQGQPNGDWFYEMRDLGYNYRLSDIACALGISQLPRLADNISWRREIAARYMDTLQDCPGIVLPIERPGVKCAWHLFPIRLDLNQINVRRKEIFQALRGENIGVNVHYIPVHLHPYYRERFGYEGGEYPVAEKAYDSMITLPLFHSMSDHDVEDVVRAVRRVADYYAK
jgi:UDP-4-amino-4,6-dideoxy-N-acetyl-beta-L-altrosamine transaminase